METVEVVIKIPRDRYETLVELNDRIKKGESIYKLGMYEKEIANGILLPEGHGKIVDLGNIDKDKIEQDNPIITISINGSEIEAVSLDYLYDLPDLTKKEE